MCSTAIRQPWLAMISLALFLCADDLQAGPFGEVDPTFTSPRFTERAYPVRCFSDGRSGLLWSLILSGNDFGGANLVRVGGLVRTTEDGIVDGNFVVGPALQDAAGVAVQPDGKILVGGRLVGDLATNGMPNFRVIRLLTNGVLDQTYHSPVFLTAPRFMTLQPDGKLLAATVGVSNGEPNNGGINDLARLNADGSNDDSFQRPVLANGQLGLQASPVVDDNGDIYVVGGFYTVNGQSRLNVARLFPNGAVDPNFLPAGFTSVLGIRAILLQPDGKVIIAGRLKANNIPSSPYFPLMRLNHDGFFDPFFSLVSSDTINFIRPRRLTFTTDGKLLAVDTSMVRFHTDGLLDNTFTRLPFDNPAVLGAFCSWFEQVANGRIVIPADPSAGIGPTTIGNQPFNGAVRLMADGTLDHSFSQPNFQTETFPCLLANQSDGQLLIAGAFDHVGSNAIAKLARVRTNGQPDASYSLGVSNVISVLGLAPIPTNQTYALLQTGDLLTANTSNLLVRLQPDGTVDPAFNLDPASINSGGYYFTDLFVQDGQPILAGSPSPQALLDQTNVPMARFRTNGARDAGFQSDTPVIGWGESWDGMPINDWSQATVYNIGQLTVGDLQILAGLPGGKLLAAQGFYTYQLVRLNTNGLADSSYSGVTVGPAGAVSVLATVHDHFGGVGQVQTYSPIRCLTGALVQSNGSVLLAGSFTNVSGTFRPGIARLKPDASLDPAFPAGAGPFAGGGLPIRISGISVDEAGKVWVSGNFEQWDSIVSPGYVRLNPDGSVDQTCLSRSTHYPVNDLTVFSGVLPGANACYVFGPHQVPGDSWPRPLSRLIPNFPPPLTPLGMLPGMGFRMSFNPEVGQSYWLQTSPDLETWDNWRSIDATGGQLFFTDSDSLQLPRRFYRVLYQ